jgi:hypothetical protein
MQSSAGMKSLPVVNKRKTLFSRLAGRTRTDPAPPAPGPGRHLGWLRGFQSRRWYDSANSVTSIA